MSLNSIMSTGLSGLITAQTGLSVTSDNIANVNTPGYVRKLIDQVSLSTQGMGAGVTVADITRAANAYLQRASLQAGADAGQTGVTADMLDRLQSLFGDPSADTGYFNQVNQVFTDLSAAAADPSSSLTRSQALGSVTTFLDQSQRIGASITGLQSEADSRIGSDVDQANSLLAQIDKLNTDITRAQVVGGDATGSENAQSQLINQLSSLMDVQVSARANGGVNVRSGDGTLLAGAGAATFTYTPSSGGVGKLTVTPAGSTTPANAKIASGELRGLLDLRNTTLPGAASQLGEFVSRTVAALNAAHNASSSVPAPATLTGRNTGTDLPTAVSGFGGKTTVAVLDANGVVQQRVDIDFTAGTMSANGGAATAFTPGNFLSSLNGALGGAGTASFSNGALSISASASGSGVAIADDATTPSAKAGQGFSQFFGLNDLISSSGFPNYQTGLTPGSASNFNGGTIALRLTDSSGSPLADVSVTLPSGGTMADVLSALNSSSGGVGAYGQFALDSQGSLSFTPGTTSNAKVSVISDTTQSGGAGGPSLSALFGIGDAQRGSRTAGFSIRGDITANASKLAFAQLNLSAAAGTPALAAGDNRGALLLAGAGDATTQFDAAGNLGAIQTSVSNYAAQFGGTLGRQSAAADQAQSSAQAVQTEADARRQSSEGVNLDEELVNLTTYQQAYNASARLITASKDMYDVLMNMGA